MTDSTPSDGEHTPVSKSKDPARPKRKKARRACLACQRAHLTCGDERPCQRCIKRGLQDACHDGMRKKAKYLHDAPNEALVPGAGETYHLHRTSNHDPDQISPTANQQSQAFPVADEAAQAGGQVTFEAFNRTSGDHLMVPPLTEQPNYQPYVAQRSPLESRLQHSPSFQHDSSRPPDVNATNVQTYDPQFFDTSDSSFLNFDLASMNFGNHYGALEFGILGHLSSGANDTMVHPNHHRQSSGSYEVPNTSSLGYVEDIHHSKYSLNIGSPLADWQRNPSGHGLQMNSWNTSMSHQDLALNRPTQSEPHAYSIGATMALSTMSPESNAADGATPHDRGYPDPSILSNPQQVMHDREHYQQYSQDHQAPPYMDNVPNETIAKKLGSLPAGNAQIRRRRRNPSSIYSSVTKPYPYTQAFHAMTAVLERCLSLPRRVAIAQALGSIRPSFISCMRGLEYDDLVFMEKCFQRQLMEYEDYISACGTPTIVCRRTGEVAYAGKEFSLLTGWSKDVLLGKAPNLNVNGRELTSGSMTGTSSRTGFNTPRVPIDAGRSEGQDHSQPARPQAVFIAELLDGDSVVQFYEDFAKLAFADSKGNAWSSGKLLKYKTKDDPSMKSLLDPDGLGSTAEAAKEQPIRGYGESSRVRTTQGDVMHEHTGIGKLGQPASSSVEKLNAKTKVDCIYCWTVRRDVFDIPMLIVINLPRYKFLVIRGSE